MRLLTNAALKELLEEAKLEGYREGWNKALSEAHAYYAPPRETGYRELPERRARPMFIPFPPAKRLD